MKTFKYQRLCGCVRTVGCVAQVRFTAAHVVFYDAEGRMLIAERAEQVNELHEPDGGDEE